MNNNTPLRIEPKEMRRLADIVIAEIIDHQVNQKYKPLSKPSNKLEEVLQVNPFKEEGKSFEGLLNLITREIYKETSLPSNPRFLGYIPGPSNFISNLADLIISGFNSFSGSQLVGKGPAKVERQTINWLLKSMGLPETGGGLFLSGGSMANMSALETARRNFHSEDWRNFKIYGASQTHASVKKGLRVLGFEADQYVPIDHNEEFSIDLNKLKIAIEKDKEKGYIPFVIVGNAGTTNTGAIDDIQSLREIADSHKMWLHIDGAYGAASVLTEEGKKLLKGVETVDSITLDPHKWWFQPYEAGCLLVKNKEHLLNAFHIEAEYLKETYDDAEQLNYYNQGIQLTRNFKALKLWLSLQFFGVAEFRRAIQLGMDLAKRIEENLMNQGDWTIVTPARLAIINFRPKLSNSSEQEEDQLTRAMIGRFLEDGKYIITSTELLNRPVVRLCIINPELTRKEIDQLSLYIYNVREDLMKSMGLNK
ncbi:pyridoxal phosphate-dependent decarboxylase family protein [Marinigracilibium pacificum]|uniref:Aminotransferase class I/II-fold pyridoxal phosphate-dependent enzyme n=1 Tax=Marinigracilibium pacificum TaxID=2729599 RepID=A0A848IV86_9BACT|nr:aminotransferase class I/II-fold pyridoxal phosphate-dependent enzyme [Marinigracilibium pacificum]NMM48247.1 aminotransferase class I/II-fold pyridoxal phosphate-dependent enzyme [Marinigracilibium pacificum]